MAHGSQITGTSGRDSLVRLTERIHLAGIDDAAFYKVDNIEKAADTIPHEEFSILLSHTPEIYRQAARQRLGIETDHEAQIFGQGLRFFLIENLLFSGRLITGFIANRPPKLNFRSMRMSLDH